MLLNCAYKMLESIKSSLWSDNQQDFTRSKLTEDKNNFSPIIFRKRSPRQDAIKKFDERYRNHENYFSTRSTLIGIKPLDTINESIYNTLPPTSEVMQEYYREMSHTRRRLKFGYVSPKCSIRVDTQYNVLISVFSNKHQSEQISFDIRNISGYGSHYDYLDVFSIIVVDELFEYIPTCLVFKFHDLKDRHKMAESFIETLNEISSELNGIFCWDSSFQ